MDCKKTDNVDVPSAYVGLKILLVDQDTTSLSKVAAILEEHSFKVTAIEQATVALSILHEHIDQFDLVMVDANMFEMDYLEFIKSAQLIKDKPIILMSPEVTMEMVLEAKAQGALYILRKSSISSMQLKNAWQYVNWHNNKKQKEKLQHNKANQVDVMDNTSCAKKLQDRKGKSIANFPEIYQMQAAGTKRMRSANDEVQVRRCSTLEQQEDHSLLSKTTIERPEKKRRHLRWTPDMSKKLDQVVRELGEKAPTRQILERMRVPDLTTKQLVYHLKKYQFKNQQAPNVQVATSTNFNEEHHFNLFNSSDLSTNLNELFQGSDIPQPLEVPFVASQSSNDSSLNWWNEWDELLELDDFELK